MSASNILETSLHRQDVAYSLAGVVVSARECPSPFRLPRHISLDSNARLL